MGSLETPQWLNDYYDGLIPIVTQQRLKTDEYEDVETFSHDIYLLFHNAIKFYASDLQEHKDAIKLQEVFTDAKARLCTQMDEQGTHTLVYSQLINANISTVALQCDYFNQGHPGKFPAN